MIKTNRDDWSTGFRFKEPVLQVQDGGPSDMAADHVNKKTNMGIRAEYEPKVR